MEPGKSQTARWAGRLETQERVAVWVQSQSAGWIPSLSGSSYLIINPIQKESKYLHKNIQSKICGLIRLTITGALTPIPGLLCVCRWEEEEEDRKLHLVKATSTPHSMGVNFVTFTLFKQTTLFVSDLIPSPLVGSGTVWSVELMWLWWGPASAEDRVRVSPGWEETVLRGKAW